MNTGSIQTFDLPIDSVAKDGSVASSFCFDRLQRGMPGYGYVSQSGEALYPRSAGVSELLEVNLDSGSITVLLTAADLLGLSNLNCDGENGAFFTHTNYSWCGRFIFFLFRQVSKSDRWKRETELFCYDRIGCWSTERLPREWFHIMMSLVVAKLWPTALKGIDAHYVFSTPHFRLTG